MQFQVFSPGMIQSNKSSNQILTQIETLLSMQKMNVTSLMLEMRFIGLKKIDSPIMENPESAETTSYTLHNDSGSHVHHFVWKNLKMTQQE